MKNKIIWIIDQYDSTKNTGKHHRHTYFAKEWIKQGYSVYIISSGVHHLLHNKPNLTQKITEEKIEDDFSFIWLKLPEYSHAHDKKRILGWFVFSWYLFKLEKYIPKPSVIFYSSPAPFGILSSYQLANKYETKLVFEEKDIWPMTLMELGGYSKWHPFILLMQWVQDFAYKKSDIVVSNLKNAVEFMKYRGMNEEKFSWIPNGFSLEDVGNIEPLPTHIDMLLPKNKFLVGYTGTLGLSNCLDTFVEAASLLKDYEDIAFVMVGEGKDERYLKELVNNQRLKNVLFIPALPKCQVQSILNKFSVLWLGSKKSSLYKYGIASIKLYEYLYAEKPVIHSIDAGGYKPVIEANAGFQVPPEDSQAIKEGIIKLYKMDKKTREDLGNNGREAVLKNYEYSQLASKLLRLFE